MSLLEDLKRQFQANKEYERRLLEKVCGCDVSIYITPRPVTERELYRRCVKT